VHALAHAMNAALGNAGKTVTYTDPVIDQPTDLHNSLRELVQDMDAGQVTTLLIIGANPAYTAPADIPFASAYQKVAQRIYVGMYHDETAALSQWYIPEAHFLEAWGDVRAHDGTVAIVQPLIEPLFNGRSAAEILALFTSPTPSSSYDIVRAYWQGQHGGGDFDAWWQGALNRGIVPDTSVPATNPTVDTGRIDSALATQGGSGGLEIIFQPDPSVWDGRFANNGWLQELPKPLTKVTWDNPILISPATAQRLGLQNEDEVELRYNGRAATAPVYVLPGHADESVTVHLGYGRGQEAGRVAAGVGFNAYRLRTSTRPWFDQGLEIVKTGGKHPLATTQYHWKMEGRDLVHVGTQQQYQQNPNFLQKAPEPISLYPKWQYTGNSWGMAIDMTACIGCNACVIACQAENNIPVVGKEMVLRQREMHWLRVDRYYEGSLDDPQTVFQPVPCMHCENAPCEAVCPVGATVHSQDGLNDMVYNRCVGTRYCSNNCPYKVRRFNFFSYTDNLASEPTLKMMQNPDVTVRNRGVMEKCTYCVQRIREADSRASAEGRTVQDGEVMTACQAVCPANAISFGNMNDQNAEVTKWKALPLNYALLAELNTQPHTTYLAALRNPNPEIEALAPRAEAAPRSGAE
jgi:molybdopterin-containing oxidoreductase family iron-sulfur binding subunit